MRKVNIHEAKTTLSQLIEAVEGGETIVLARAGKPVAKLTRYVKPRGVRLGLLERKLSPAFLAAVERPLDGDELAALFGTPLEPGAREVHEP